MPFIHSLYQETTETYPLSFTYSSNTNELLLLTLNTGGCVKAKDRISAHLYRPMPVYGIPCRIRGE